MQGRDGTEKYVNVFFVSFNVSVTGYIHLFSKRKKLKKTLFTIGNTSIAPC